MEQIQRGRTCGLSVGSMALMGGLAPLHIDQQGFVLHNRLIQPTSAKSGDLFEYSCIISLKRLTVVKHNRSRGSETW